MNLASIYELVKESCLLDLRYRGRRLEIANWSNARYCLLPFAAYCDKEELSSLN
jgi:hypothetical protein